MTSYFPLWKAGLLSSIWQILTGLFLHKIRGFARYFSPFEGGWGDVKSVFSRIIGINTKNIPLAPFKRGNCIVQTKITGNNFNIYTLVKQNLTALLFEGGRRNVKSVFSKIVGIITKNIPLAPFKRGNDSVQTRILEKKINILPLLKQDLTAQFWKGGVIMILFLITISLNAQNQLTQSFRFENGVYQTFEAFQKNRPTHTGNMIDGNFFINEKTKQAKVEYIRLKGTGKKLDLDEIWGVVIRGIPYVKTSPNLPAHNLKVFASMEVRGSICYYAYDDIEEKEVTFRAYNPLIGKPFRTGKAMRKLPVIKEKMLRFATGEVTDFNYQNLLEWVAEEPDIIQALKSLGPVGSEDKLFDALLLYNDKHVVNLPINQ